MFRSWDLDSESNHASIHPLPLYPSFRDIYYFLWSYEFLMRTSTPEIFLRSYPTYVPINVNTDSGTYKVSNNIHRQWKANLLPPIFTFEGNHHGTDESRVKCLLYPTLLIIVTQGKYGNLDCGLRVPLISVIHRYELFNWNFTCA